MYYPIFLTILCLLQLHVVVLAFQSTRSLRVVDHRSFSFSSFSSSSSSSFILPPPPFHHLNPLRLGEDFDYISLDGYQSLTTTTPAASSANVVAADSSVWIAVGVAALALLGLSILQFLPLNNNDNDKEEDGSNDQALQPLLKLFFNNDSSKTDSTNTKSNKNEKGLLEIEPTLKESSIKEKDIDKTTHVEKKKAETAVRTSSSVLFFAREQQQDDDLTRLEQEATKAALDVTNNGLLNSINRVIDLVRKSRKELKTEQHKRQQVEITLQETIQEITKLEDSLEMEQNQLVKTTFELGTTKEKLITIEKQLQQLQQEQQSFRKIGKYAWKLSKQRISNRLRRITRRRRGRGPE